MKGLPTALVEMIAVLGRLPGIGPKSANRLAFFIFGSGGGVAEELITAIKKVKSEVKLCRKCFSAAEGDWCGICQDEERDKRVICVVERTLDVVAIEKIGGFRGVYHVLGGLINPLEHIGPEDLRIGQLIERLGEEVEELILAFNPTLEGEATALYINRIIGNLKGKNIKVSRIGSGLPMGADMEFADTATLSRALEGRRIM